MKPDLSIIIPCYNCEKTLEQAVLSCYKQNLNNFEIILVNDFSTDNTQEIINDLSKRYPNIKTYNHDRNKGGGATRNTAVENASSEIIFCLDSDDVLPEGTLSKMLFYLKEKNCDGVCFNKSIKFKGSDINSIDRIDEFGYTGEKIPFESLLETTTLCPLYCVFMFTKKAFKITDGYPTTHGFDTQGFAWRFLAKGLTAYTCPNTSYLHRVYFHESYYLREHNSGKTNRNWQMILDEFIFLFNKEAQDIIINGCKNTQNLFDEIKKINNPFVLNINEVIKQNIDRNSIDIKVKPQKTINRSSLLGFYYRLKNKLRIYHDIIKNRKYNIRLLLNLTILKLKKKLKISFSDTSNKNSYIDIVIPTLLKDEHLLGEILKSLYFINHNINKIFVITPKTEKSLTFCEKNNCILIDENTVLPYTNEILKNKFHLKNRSGWIFQQLLKLGADNFVTTENYITLDDDTIFIAKQSFIKKNKFIIRQSTEWHKPYYITFEKIFGYKTKSYLSSICHMMIFNKKMLQEMKKEIENKHGAKWHEIIINNIDKNIESSFSEFETYSNWLRKRHPEIIKHKPFYNKNLNRRDFTSLEKLIEKYSNIYTTISFQEHDNK